MVFVMIILVFGEAPLSSAEAQQQPPPPISANDFGVTSVPAAKTPTSGSYYVYLYVVTTLEPGTKVTFKRLDDTCTSQEFDSSFDVKTKPLLENLRAFYVPTYNPLQKCFNLPSIVHWKVTATHGTSHQQVEIFVSQKPQLPLQQDYATQCVPRGTLPWTGGQQPSTPLPKVIFGKPL
jgi:hypothetical protein